MGAAGFEAFSDAPPILKNIFKILAVNAELDRLINVSCLSIDQQVRENREFIGHRTSSPIGWEDLQIVY